MSNKNTQIEKILSNFQAFRRKMSVGGDHMHRDFGMTMAQAGVLMLVKKNGAMNSTEIAGLLGVSKSAATQLVDGLVANNFITREADKDDRRVTIIKTSTKGDAYFENTRKKAFAQFYNIFSVLDETELKQLADITTKLVESNEGEQIEKATKIL